MAARHPAALAAVLLAACGRCRAGRARTRSRSVPTRSGASRSSTPKTARPATARGPRSGAAIGLANPVYLAIADDARRTRATAQGVPGTLMPAFARSAGGMLTDQQVAILVAGMRAWAARSPRRRGPSVLPRARRRRGAGKHASSRLPARRAMAPEARAAEGRLDRRRLVPRPRERPGAAHDGDRGAARHRACPTGAATPGRAPDGRAGLRRRRVAGRAAAGNPGRPTERRARRPARRRERHTGGGSDERHRSADPARLSSQARASR